MDDSIRQSGEIPIAGAVAESTATTDSCPTRAGKALFEDYYFKRLPKLDLTRLHGHVLGCSDCQGNLERTKVFVGVMRNVLRPSSNRVTNYATTAGPVLVPRATRTASLSGPTHPFLRFSPADLSAACDRLPLSKLVLARCLSALNSRYADLDEVEQLVLQDPGTSAHLLQVANSALLSSGGQIRSVGRAMMQIGFERTKLHILGLSVRGSFSAPSLQRLWNHSIRIAELARDVAAISQAAPPDEASLIGIVHDIGRLALAGLGRDFENGRAKLQAAGFSRLDAERELCGSNHARIGAELLASWLFPSDMVEAIRGHHAPSRSQSPLAALLFIAESWAGDNQEGHYEQGDNEQGDEDAWDRIEHSFALRRLNLKARDLKPLGTNHHPDLQLLRFAAAA